MQLRTALISLLAALPAFAQYNAQAGVSAARPDTLDVQTKGSRGEIVHEKKTVDPTVRSGNGPPARGPAWMSFKRLVPAGPDSCGRHKRPRGRAPESHDELTPSPALIGGAYRG